MFGFVVFVKKTHISKVNLKSKLYLALRIYTIL